MDALDKSVDRLLDLVLGHGFKVSQDALDT